MIILLISELLIRERARGQWLDSFFADTCVYYFLHFSLEILINNYDDSASTKAVDIIFTIHEIDFATRDAIHETSLLDNNLIHLSAR